MPPTHLYCVQLKAGERVRWRITHCDLSRFLSTMREAECLKASARHLYMGFVACFVRSSRLFSSHKHVTFIIWHIWHILSKRQYSVGNIIVLMQLWTANCYVMSVRSGWKKHQTVTDSCSEENVSCVKVLWLGWKWLQSFALQLEKLLFRSSINHTQKASNVTILKRCHYNHWSCQYCIFTQVHTTACTSQQELTDCPRIVLHSHYNQQLYTS